MTDREVMMLIYAALQKLHIRLTGEPLAVSIETAQGMISLCDYSPTTAPLASECSEAKRLEEAA